MAYIKIIVNLKLKKNRKLRKNDKNRKKILLIFLQKKVISANQKS